MKYLMILGVLLGMSGAIWNNNNKNSTQPLSCMDGYLFWNEEMNGFCLYADGGTSGIVGMDCYGVSGSSPRANIQKLVLRQGYYAKTKCYNADRDN